MAELRNEKLGSGLVYTESVPFLWRELAAWPAEAAAASLAHQSQQVLRLILSLEEQVSEPQADGEPEQEDLARLEFKINLLIDLVGYLLAQQVQIPPRVTVNMSANGLEWLGDTAPRQGGYVELELYLSPRYPRPVILPAFVDAVETTPEGYRTHAIFPELSAPLQDTLERFIFRYHRRIIASRRDAEAAPPTSAAAENLRIR